MMYGFTKYNGWFRLFGRGLLWMCYESELEDRHMHRQKLARIGTWRIFYLYKPKDQLARWRKEQARRAAKGRIN